VVSYNVQLRVAVSAQFIFAYTVFRRGLSVCDGLTAPVSKTRHSIGAADLGRKAYKFDSSECQSKCEYRACRPENNTVYVSPPRLSWSRPAISYMYARGKPNVPNFK
jgi:hypothetical protein